MTNRASDCNPHEAPRRLKPAARKGPLRRTDVTEHELDGELLIFDPETADTHRLNGTALFIWQLCDGTRDATDLAEALAAAYEVSPDGARTHVGRLLHELSDRDLFVRGRQIGQMASVDLQPRENVARPKPRPNAPSDIRAD